MTCDEFERVLPELEGGHNLEQEQHLRTCAACAELLSDLNAIEHNARLLSDHEPSPRVWNNIEAALRREGLIRQPQPQLLPTRAESPRWRFAWLVPVAAGLLFGAGLLIMHQQANNQWARQAAVTPAAESAQTVPATATAAVADDPIITLVAARAPTMRASYESDLRAVDAYIHDAELAAQNNPNDEISQQHLTNAYEQRAMVYEMAMHRALP
ncbi:MAG: anti-sigma factor [Acidobacteriaceae bacterium]|nr:anti-sigma factor [Acidobacteriaceae bacterium]